MKKEIETFCPKNKQDWRKWLEKHHEIKKSIWLIFYKKSSLKANLSWSEAVEEALCFGWIDSVKKSIDKEKYKQYYSHRKANSTWSKINKEHVKRLIASGEMKVSGMKCIEIAKQNGSWKILDSAENLEIPEDLEKVLNEQAVSKDYFLSLSKSSRRSMLHWVALAKRPETRQHRINEIAECARMKKKPKQF